jgi:hypothetical protein
MKLELLKISHSQVLFFFGNPLEFIFQLGGFVPVLLGPFVRLGQFLSDLVDSLLIMR